MSLGASDDQLDFPFVYAIAKQGKAKLHLEDDNENLEPLLDLIISKVPAPKVNPNEPFRMLLLMFAARAQHLAQVIEPALQQEQWVLCDRFTDATYAYQGGGRKMDDRAIHWLENLVQGKLH